MSVIRSLAGGGSTGNILRTTGPAPSGPGLVPNIAGLQLLGGPVPDPVGVLDATETGADSASITGTVDVTGRFTAVEGSNQVLANPGFDDTSAWIVDTAGGSSFITGGVLHAITGARFLVQTGVLVAGKTYAYSLEWTSTAGAQLRIGNSPTTNGADIVVGEFDVNAGSGPQSKSGTFTALNTAFSLEAANLAFTGTVDNVQVWLLEGAGDSASISGTVVGDPTGTLAATESGNDTASITGTVLVEGSLAATESGSDTASVAGTVLVAGSLAATEAAGSDTASVTGTVLVAGPLSATEAAGQDAASISGTVAVAGPLSATEGAGQDTASGTGSVLVAGPLAATETGQDSASITGSVSDGASGSLAATETGTDTAAVAGDVAVSGSQDALESGSDTAGLTGTVAVEGALAASETGQDTAEIREAAPVVAEEPRRGGPALRYSRRDRIAEYLEVRRQRLTRKRSLDELLEELLPTHSSEANPAPIVSSPRSRDKAEDADLALERAADVARPSAQRIATAAITKAAEVVTEDRKARREAEAKAKLIQTRRRRAIALLLAA